MPFQENNNTILPTNAALSAQFGASVVFYANVYSQLGRKVSVLSGMGTGYLLTEKQNKIQIAWHCVEEFLAHKGTVIICHPNDKRGMSSLITEGFHIEFAKKGYNTVFLNLRGFGESTYSPDKEFYRFSDDILFVSKWAKSMFKTNLHLFGLSFSGTWVCYAAAQEPNLFTSVIFDGAPVIFSNTLKQKNPNAYAIAERVERFALYESNLGMKPLHKGILQNIRVPILGLFGDRDPLVPLEDIDLMSKSNENFEAKKFRNCRHLEAMKKNKPEYFDKIFEFLNKCALKNKNNMHRAKL